ncbi:helix-turn-helix domain-containing protein [Streptomyces sp. NPDC058572]|uniref:helix-turn-helix domain-containing protein n=1 Tax=Streptomyces sp. NPDC058572 TaxID=3346546 RepID=UPI00365D9FAF
MSHASVPRGRRPSESHASPLRKPSRLDADATAVLRRATQVLVDDVTGLTGRVVVTLREQEPSYRAAMETDPDVMWQELHRCLRQNVGSLTRPGEGRDAALRASWEIGGRRAEQGLPLEAVQHAFRLGGAMVWQGLMDETARYDPGDVRLLVHVAADLWNFVDDHCVVVAEAYRRAERHLEWRRANRLRLLAAAILDGNLRPSDLADAAAVLDLPEHGQYVVIAVEGEHHGRVMLPPGTRAIWHPSADGDLAIVLLDEAADDALCGRSGPAPEPVRPREQGREISEPTGSAAVPADSEQRYGGPGEAAPGCASHPVGPGPVRGSGVEPARDVAGPAGPRSAATSGPRRARPGPAVPAAITPAGLAARLAVPPGVRVGISSAVTGLAAVGDARRLAGTALRVCERAGGVALLDDHLPAALVVSSPALGTALAERMLGPLDAVDPVDRELIVETLAAWLDEGGSAQRAAARLYCHRNTVMNRLRRFEQLTGRSLAQPSDAVMVSLALAARRLLGA